MSREALEKAVVRKHTRTAELARGQPHQAQGPDRLWYRIAQRRKAVPRQKTYLRPTQTEDAAMDDPELTRLEREVEAARAKLSGDLSILRSPETTSQFAEALTQGALDNTKDAVLEKAKAQFHSTASSIVEDLKARAAENPAAVLAIGAGIAWKLARHPPITTALVGAGLFSLFRTGPARVNGHATEDYVSHAKRRFGEQASGVAEAAKAEALELSKSVTENVRGTVHQLKSHATDLTAQAASATRDFTENANQGASEMLSSRAEPASDPAVQDKLLLGAAGVAIVAALAIAYERSADDH